MPRHHVKNQSLGHPFVKFSFDISLSVNSLVATNCTTELRDNDVWYAVVSTSPWRSLSRRNKMCSEDVLDVRRRYWWANGGYIPWIARRLVWNELTTHRVAASVSLGGIRTLASISRQHSTTDDVILDSDDPSAHRSPEGAHASLDEDSCCAMALYASFVLPRSVASRAEGCFSECKAED